LIYTIEKAALLTRQLERFTTGYAHHAAGQYANIEFWITEIEQSLQMLDEYNDRFFAMRDAQQAWVDSHGTIRHCPICRGPCDLASGAPEAPVRTASGVLQEARRALSDAGYKLLLRYYRLDLIKEDQLKSICVRIDSGFDPSDLKAAKARN